MKFRAARLLIATNSVVLLAVFLSQVLTVSGQATGSASLTIVAGITRGWTHVGANETDVLGDGSGLLGTSLPELAILCELVGSTEEKLYNILPEFRVPGLWLDNITIPLGSWSLEKGTQLRCELWDCDGFRGCSYFTNGLPSASAGDDLLATADIFVTDFKDAPQEAFHFRPSDGEGEETALFRLQCEGCSEFLEANPDFSAPSPDDDAKPGPDPPQTETPNPPANNPEEPQASPSPIPAVAPSPSPIPPDRETGGPPPTETNKPPPTPAVEPTSAPSILDRESGNDAGEDISIAPGDSEEGEQLEAPSDQSKGGGGINGTPDPDEHFGVPPEGSGVNVNEEDDAPAPSGAEEEVVVRVPSVEKFDRVNGENPRNPIDDDQGQNVDPTDGRPPPAPNSPPPAQDKGSSVTETLFGGRHSYAKIVGWVLGGTWLIVVVFLLLANRWPKLICCARLRPFLVLGAKGGHKGKDDMLPVSTGPAFADDSALQLTATNSMAPNQVSARDIDAELSAVNSVMECFTREIILAATPSEVSRLVRRDPDQRPRNVHMLSSWKPNEDQR